MAWSNSKVFASYLEDSLARTAAFDLNSDTFKVVLYNNSITPSETVTAANTRYGQGQWAGTNEVYETGQWAQGGEALASITYGRGGTATITWDAADLSSGTSADLSNVHGCLIYDDTLTAPEADQGVCYNYFGGSASVANGTFTIVWNSSGIATFAV